MQYQATFERYEIKYLLSPEEKEQLLKIMAPYMKLTIMGARRSAPFIIIPTIFVSSVAP